MTAGRNSFAIESPNVVLSGKLWKLPVAFPRKETAPSDSGSALEERLLTAVGSERRGEAMEVIETGRVSWKLRDDDNLLVAPGVAATLALLP